jgi:hypothetical protein
MDVLFQGIVKATELYMFSSVHKSNLLSFLIESRFFFQIGCCPLPFTKSRSLFVFCFNNYKRKESDAPHPETATGSPRRMFGVIIKDHRNDSPNPQVNI